ncbi:MAG TPA: type IV toxin-antitoxin system AbiEi family antitoxin domain-containing protein, partial [Acidimicrobiia bacterium]|nr:type IV toxin-antitoxin system AbiEi family antitoxin domain-containing protein [Acidimicrobiia bacterium]
PLENHRQLWQVRPMKADYELVALASSQAGFLGHDQVEACGLSRAAIKHRVDTGLWFPISRGL